MRQYDYGPKSVGGYCEPLIHIAPLADSPSGFGSARPPNKTLIRPLHVSASTNSLLHTMLRPTLLVEQLMVTDSLVYNTKRR